MRLFDRPYTYFGCFILTKIIRTIHTAELALECASAYYRYGSVLLYQAQENADVFGAPLHEENNEENGFDKENEEADTTRKGKDEMDKGKGPKPREENEPAEHHANADDDQGGQEVDGGDLQLAWENLETARAIWSRTDPEVYAQELSGELSALLCFLCFYFLSR